MKNLNLKLDELFYHHPLGANLILLCSCFITLYSVIILCNLNTLEAVLDNHWQIADINALRKDPLLALLHLHSQPPLFNFIFWLLSHLPGTSYDKFVIYNSFCQSIVTLIVITITSQIVKKRVVGIVVGLLYILSPPVLLNSAYPFYPPLTSMGFAILTYGFFILKSQPKISSYLIAFSICYLYLIRSSFSLFAAMILLILYLFLSKKYLSKFFRITFTVLTLIVLLLLPFKNLFLYGFFSSSSWTPVNLIMTLGITPPLGPFPAPKDIRTNYPDLECKKSYGLLDTEDTKKNGEPNYNSCYYIAYIEKYGKNPFIHFDLIKYLKNVKGHVGQYFNTPDGYYFLKNREQIKNYTLGYNLAFFTLYFKFHQIRVLCILFIIFLCIRVYKYKEYFPTILLIIFSLHFFAHVLTDGGESRRHVFDIEFFFYIIFAIYISNFLRKKKISIQ
jgi:hypothetical protein